MKEEENAEFLLFLCLIHIILIPRLLVDLMATYSNRLVLICTEMETLLGKVTAVSLQIELKENESKIIIIPVDSLDRDLNKQRGNAFLNPVDAFQ